jgi:hypothetical protein
MTVISEYFWSRVRISAPDKCWEWKLGKSGHGYGRIRRTDCPEQMAHRVAWHLSRGPIPGDLCVCHACDNPACVNPAHLWLGTREENTADMKRKGRARGAPRGERHHMTKLTRKQALAIQRDPRSSTVVAHDYGVSFGTVCNIRRLGWGDLPPDNRPRIGFYRVGESNPMAKVRAADVRAIRADARTAYAIAKERGLTLSLVARIKKRETWKHVA